MANINRGANGAWRARYRTPDGKGRERHLVRKIDAQRWVDEQTAAIVTGQYADPRAGRTTFRAVAEKWRTSAAHSPTMADKVRRNLERHVYPDLGDIPIASITHTTIQGWVTKLPLAPASAKVILGYVSGVFRSAVRDRVVAANPCADVRPPAARREDVYIPDLETLGALRDALPARYRAVVDLVIGSGLRQGEVFGFDVERVPFLARSRPGDLI